MADRFNLPPLTAEKRSEALARANALRRERAEMKARLKRGEVSVEEALGAEAMQRLRVTELVGSLPGYGPAKTGELMARLGIKPSRRVRGLGRRQREALLRELGGDAE